MDSGWRNAHRRSGHLREQLTQFIYHSSMLMKPVFNIAKKNPKRLVYARRGRARVARYANRGDEGIAIDPGGTPAVIEKRIANWACASARASTSTGEIRNATAAIANTATNITA